MTRILSLDDEPCMQLLLSLILEREGYEHLAALDSDEAWAILHNLQIDLFVIDIMSDMWDFYRITETDEALRGVPVILTSGRITVDDSFTLPKIVKSWIMKPFAVSHALSTVEKVLKEHGKPLPSTIEVDHTADLFKQSVEKRVAVLRDSNDAVRRRAIWSLCHKQEANEKVIQALISVLYDDNWLIRLSAVQVLAHLEDQQAIEPLQKLVAQVPLEKLKPQKFTGISHIAWVAGVQTQFGHLIALRN